MPLLSSRRSHLLAKVVASAPRSPASGPRPKSVLLTFGFNNRLIGFLTA